jgi:hypothetical protein
MPGEWKRFRTVYDPAAPKSDRLEWRPTLRFVAKVCQEQGIALKRVHVHYHPEGEDSIPSSHPFGEAEYWNGVIYLCAWDEDTILHELAHVWSESWHTPKWASLYHALKRIYGITVKVGKRTPKESRPMSDEQRVHGRHCS